MSGQQFTEWYRFKVFTVDELGRQAVHDMHVLGFSREHCVSIACQTLDLGQMFLSMERMGTADEYISLCGPDGDESKIWDDDERPTMVQHEIVPFERKGDLDFIDDPLQ